MVGLRWFVALMGAALMLASAAAEADPAVQLQVVIQPRNGGNDAKPIAIDSGDPLTIGSQIALVVKATADATVNIRYLPSDGQPVVLAQSLALKAGEAKRLPQDPGNWYQISSGGGEERMIAEDASGVQGGTLADGSCTCSARFSAAAREESGANVPFSSAAGSPGRRSFACSVRRATKPSKTSSMTIIRLLELQA